MPSDFKDLGVGLGLRTVHYSHVLEHRPSIPWFEVISENFMGLQGYGGGEPLRKLLRFREHYPIVLHGVAMSIGSTDPLNKTHLTKLRELAKQVQPAWVSDHLCWTSVGGESLHDLLPLPYTHEALDHVVSRISQVQDFLARPLVIENVSSYVAYPHSEMTEWEFLNQVTRRSGAKLLLDVNNVYVSAHNHGYPPETFLNAIDTHSVVQFHLAGHTERDGLCIDTHDQPVPKAVWTLYESALKRFGSISTLIEWDGNIPSFERLEQEAGHANDIRARVKRTHEKPVSL